MTYSRYYTPILYEINPPVAYFGSKISFYVDPKSAIDLRGADEKPFVEAKIGTQLINYEDLVDGNTVAYGYVKNQFIGKVGEVEPANNV